MSVVLTRGERRALRRCLELLELDRSRVALSVLTGAAGLASAVALAGVAAWLIARASQMPDVIALGVAPVMVRLFGISRSVLRYCERLVSHDTALRGMNALRTHLYEILAASRSDVVARLRRGEVLSRVGSDVDAVGDLVVRGFLPLGVAASVGVASSVALALVYVPAGVILAVCLLVAGVVGPLLTVRAARAAELARARHVTDLSATVLTAVDGGSELSVAGRMDRLMADLGELEGRLARARDRGARPAAVAAAIDTLAMGVAVVGNLVVGVPAVSAGVLGPVWLAVIVLLPLAAFEATAALGPASLQLVTSAAAAERVVELIDEAEASARAVPTPVALAPSAQDGPHVRARDLAVGWPGGPVVAEGIDLDLRPGTRLGIVGPSGIGKTTLLLTLAGLLPPRGGTLTLDGVSPWLAARGEVSARITLTAEDAHVFDTSVLENLRVARGDLSREEAADLLGRAGLGAWLAGLPHGLDTIVGPDATTVSGGERRRLLLARALAAPAPLMLLDEPAEHLDPRTADRLVSDVLHAGPRRGTIVVTHRLSALAEADEIIVLGARADAPARVRARGTHAELCAQDADYRWSLSHEEARLG